MSKLVTIQDEAAMARLYTETNCTQNEVAQEFGVSPVTVRRALAEQGLHRLQSYASRKDQKILKLLEEFKLYDYNKLKEVLENAGYSRIN